MKKQRDMRVEMMLDSLFVARIQQVKALLAEALTTNNA